MIIIMNGICDGCCLTESEYIHKELCMFISGCNHGVLGADGLKISDNSLGCSVIGLSYCLTASGLWCPVCFMNNSLSGWGV